VDLRRRCDRHSCTQTITGTAPVLDELRIDFEAWTIALEHKVPPIGVALPGALTRIPEVIEDTRADVKSGDGRPDREACTQERVGERERLNHLDRMEIMPLGLVDEVESGTDNGDAFSRTVEDAAFVNRCESPLEDEIDAK
jgi:hypothetical protein